MREAGGLFAILDIAARPLLVEDLTCMVSLLDNEVHKGATWETNFTLEICPFQLLMTALEKCLRKRARLNRRESSLIAIRDAVRGLVLWKCQRSRKQPPPLRNSMAPIWMAVR